MGQCTLKTRRLRARTGRGKRLVAVVVEVAGGAKRAAEKAPCVRVWVWWCVGVWRSVISDSCLSVDRLHYDTHARTHQRR